VRGRSEAQKPIAIIRPFAKIGVSKSAHPVLVYAIAVVDMKISFAGLTQRSSPIRLRERVAFEGKAVDRGLRYLMRRRGVYEAVILSTCNRVEVYLVLDDAGDAPSLVADLFSRCCKRKLRGLQRQLASASGADAAEHLFMVASSLDSLVIGESQILGQVKEAYKQATQCGAVGLYLNRLFQSALSCAKKVRKCSVITEGKVSVSSVAADLAQEVFGDISHKRILLIGAGKMAELALKHLQSLGARHPLILNRSAARARTLSSRYGGTTASFSRLSESIGDADIVISSTGSRKPVVSRETVKEIMRSRGHAPLFIIDIAVPRDFDPTIGRLKHVHLYNIDDLEGVAGRNQQLRRKELDWCRSIVASEREAFECWFHTMKVAAVVAQLKEHLENIRTEEVDRALKKLRRLDEASLNTVSLLTQRLVNKISHELFTNLKRCAQGRDGEHLAEAARRLFDLSGQAVAEDRP